MKMQPLSDHVVIKPLAAESKTKGGIVLPDTAKEKPQEGEVVAVGKGKGLENGTVRAPEVKVGDKVKEGDTVVVTEAMKMQSDVHSPYTGKVKEIFAFNGEIVNKDDVLMVII